MNLKSLTFIACVLLTCATALAPALAATTCSVNSLGNLAFTYDPSVGTPTDSSATLTITCARRGGPATISVQIAAGPSTTSGNVNARQMLGASSGDLMNYNVYRDVGRSLILGQTAGTDTLSVSVASIPNNGSKSASVNLYGRIPALQAVGAGNYNDSLLLTISP